MQVDYMCRVAQGVICHLNVREDVAFPPLILTFDIDFLDISCKIICVTVYCKSMGEWI